MPSNCNAPTGVCRSIVVASRRRICALLGRRFLNAALSMSNSAINRAMIAPFGLVCRMRPGGPKNKQDGPPGPEQRERLEWAVAAEVFANGVHLRGVPLLGDFDVLPAVARGHVAVVVNAAARPAALMVRSMSQQWT